MVKPHPPRSPVTHRVPGLSGPVWVYDNWSAYTDGVYAPDDHTRLTEALALEQLEEIARLQRYGVRFDYYLMNAFWFDPDGGYRTFRKADWPEGPDRWLEGCARIGVKPGLWFGTNAFWKINPVPAWRSSYCGDVPDSANELAVTGAMSLSQGGFLHDFMDVLQSWYEKGVRLFEFDAARFEARGPGEEAASQEVVRERNKAALRDALRTFRVRNPDAITVAFNHFGGDLCSTTSPLPFRNSLDLRWLEVFDTLYTGDTRVSDVPMVNFWRSVDLFSDHMVRQFELSGLPLERADPFFTLSTTHFGYRRFKRAWKSSLLLTLARGTWKKTIYGSLALLGERDAEWFAKLQAVYHPLLAYGRTRSFGGIPGRREPYGFVSFDRACALYTVVNPGQTRIAIKLPSVGVIYNRPGRILFTDAGAVPTLEQETLTLGPEQCALVGFAEHVETLPDLGIESDIVIPGFIERVPADVVCVAGNTLEAQAYVPDGHDLRVLLVQRSSEPDAPRCTAMTIEVEQGGLPIELHQNDQSRTAVSGSTGISWGAMNICATRLRDRMPVTVRCASNAKADVELCLELYAVKY